MDLSRIALSAREVERLVTQASGMHSLEMLSFVCCTLRAQDMPAVCDALVEFANLRELELARNRLGDLGVQHLAKVLPDVC